jgi:putative membrane protein
MVYLIINWVVSTLGLLVVAGLFPGFRILEVESALVAAAAVGLVHAALASLFQQAAGSAMRLLSGLLLLLLLVDTVLFRLAALLVPGFAMLGLLPAFAGGLVLLALNLVLLRLARAWQAAYQSEPAIR